MINVPFGKLMCFHNVSGNNMKKMCYNETSMRREKYFMVFTQKMMNQFMRVPSGQWKKIKIPVCIINRFIVT